MPRYTQVAWWCWRGHRNDGGSSECATCKVPFVEKHANVHPSERAAVWFNPHTGKHKTPPRNDIPLPEKYAQQGYERREINHMGSYERETGVIHEASNFHPGNAEVETLKTPSMPKAPPALIDELVNELRK